MAYPACRRVISNNASFAWATLTWRTDGRVRRRCADYQTRRLIRSAGTGTDDAPIRGTGAAEQRCQQYLRNGTVIGRWNITRTANITGATLGIAQNDGLDGTVEQTAAVGVTDYGNVSGEQVYAVAISAWNRHAQNNRNNGCHRRKRVAPGVAGCASRNACGWGKRRLGTSALTG